MKHCNPLGKRYSHDLGRLYPHFALSISFTALFSAVEHGHLEKARTILESTDVDVNSVNSDGLAPLDVAVLSNNRSMTKMLLQHGATDRSQCESHNPLYMALNSKERAMYLIP